MVFEIQEEALLELLAGGEDSAHQFKENFFNIEGVAKLEKMCPNEKGDFSENPPYKA